MPDEIMENVEPIDESEIQVVPEEGGVSESSLPGMPVAAPKPRSNIFTLMLIIAFMVICLAVYLTMHELNKYYGVTFGGILSAPVESSEVVK